MILPKVAADELGRPPFSIADLAHETTWAAVVDVGLVEGVGGPRSPIASDGDNVDLAHELAPDLVVLVADAAAGVQQAARQKRQTLTARVETAVALLIEAQATTTCTSAVASVRRQRAPWSLASITTSSQLWPSGMRSSIERR